MSKQTRPAQVGKLIFDLTTFEGRDQMQKCLNVDSYHSVLFDISQEIFRPARKHGYSRHAIRELYEQNPEFAAVLIGELESLFNELLSDSNIDIYG